MAKSEKPRVTVWTAPGRVSFPFFTAPDTGREYSDNKYKGDLIIPKAVFKEQGKALQDAVMSVGREYFGDKFTLKGKWRHPFKDMDNDDNVVLEAMKGCMMVRAKSSKAPVFIGPRKVDGNFPELTSQQIADIKGGDWCVFNVTAFPYDQQGGGISLGLNVVQFWKPDAAFGQGRSKILESAEELTIELETPDNSTEVEESII